MAVGASIAGRLYVVRIWERTGALHAVGEAAPGLAGPIAWQPNGRNLYAAATGPANVPSVLIFERNGLRHGGWDLEREGASTIFPASEHGACLLVHNHRRRLTQRVKELPTECLTIAH